MNLPTAASVQHGRREEASGGEEGRWGGGARRDHQEKQGFIKFALHNMSLFVVKVLEENLFIIMAYSCLRPKDNMQPVLNVTMLLNAHFT